MSETNRYSPEQQTSVHTIPNAPEALQPATLDDLVNYRKEIDTQYDATDRDDYRAFKAEKLDELLAENGIVDSEADEQQHENYEFSKLVYQQIINLRSDAEWLGANADGVVPRDDVLRAVRQQYNPDGIDTGVVAASPEAVYEAEKAKQAEKQNGRDLAESLSETDKRLETIKAAYAKEVAERSKRMIEGSKTRADIDASKEELGDIIGALSTQYMLDIQGATNEGVAWDAIPEATRQEIIATVDSFVAEETDKIVQQMEAHRMDEYNNARPAMKKFYDKWASWGEQGLKGKVKKGLVFAAPGAALGAALVPLAGAVGFGVVTGALAVTGARSVGRSLAGAHLDKRADSKKVAEAQSEDIRSRIEAAENSAHTDILAIIDERSEAYRKRNLRRTAGGLAIALTAGLLTAKAVDIVGDNVDNWSFGKLGEWTGDAKDALFPGSVIDVDGGVDDPEFRDRDGDGIRNSLDTDRDGDGVLNGNDAAPNNPNVTDAPASTREQLFDGRFGSRGLTPEGQSALAEHLSNYRVKSGDSVWSLSEQFLHEQGIKNPTVYEIDATKDTLLSELKASGDVDSRGWLTVGDKIRIK